jgi:CheY-like chemotaxis protein
VFPSPTGLSVFFADVTARVNAEMALRDAKAAAESANQLKDHFLATLSHELRTPLNAILGYARLLQTHAIPAEQRERALEVIERNAHAQNRLIEDLLDMSRITTGTVRLDPQPMPVATVLREAVDGVRPAADARRIALRLDVDPFAGTVRADPTRLQQVFWNLLTNAVKFTPEAGSVSVTLRRNDGHVEIVVADTGVGIAPEFLPFVFEPFRQAEARIDRKHGGLGLGLAITKQLVGLHGGSIGVASPGLGQGATFTVTLPATSDTASAGSEAQVAPATPASLDGFEVLLVDDEPDTLSMFRAALEQAGARVRAASSAMEALHEVDRAQPDLLVTDLGMPGMDGYELLRALRSRDGAAAYPAVAVSAYARPEDRTRSLAAGFQAHLAKPVDPTALVQALRGVLSSTP